MTTVSIAVSTGWPHACASQVRRLYEELDRLHRDVTALPLADAIQLVFERLPILELAAASLHGEQVLANLMKAKHTAAALADRPHLTLSGFVELMIGRLEDQPDEAESPLVEESLDAIQVLTVHKAKGLEFPDRGVAGIAPGDRTGSIGSLRVVRLVERHLWPVDRETAFIRVGAHSG